MEPAQPSGLLARKDGSCLSVVLVYEKIAGMIASSIQTKVLAKLFCHLKDSGTK